MASRTSKTSAIEILESRIAPAAATLPGLPTIKDAEWIAATNGESTGTGQSTFELKAGQGLSTSGALSGTYLLFVEKGRAIVFTTDLNMNGEVDYNEITGIAAGDGLRLVSFVDIHGDIVTNLKETVINDPGAAPRVILTLGDSDNNPSNDFEADGRYRGDGRTLQNTTIEKIELRSLTVADLPDQNNDGVVNDGDVAARQAISSYSIFGNIYAGRGFGVSGDPTSGLFVDSANALLPFGYPIHPMVNGIKVGTAASGEYFNFGSSARNDFQGVIKNFVPLAGQIGAQIAGVHAATGTELNINYLIAGDGGTSARGGNIEDVQLSTDNTGGYIIVAGNGGNGPFGGAGGSILNFSDSGSVTGKVIVKSGDGGVGSTGPGGSASGSLFGPFDIRGNVTVEMGDGGDGFTAGGNGASLQTGEITTPGQLGAGGLNAYGVSHIADNSGGVYVPRIGMNQAVDFNNDGFGDVVFTTSGRNQIVIGLGDGLGGFQTVANPFGDGFDVAIYLPGLYNSDALTVGDFNGDGHPDIAVASSEHGQTAGVVVYLSKFEDANNDGIVSGSENVIPDLPGETPAQINDFLGFHDGRFSAVVSAYAGWPHFPPSTIDLGNPVQINKLAAGDFDGDGGVELAAEWTVVLPDGTIAQQIAFLAPNYENGLPTGQYYVDYGTKADPAAGTPATPKIPIYDVGTGDGDIVEIYASALSTAAGAESTHDTLFFMLRAGNPDLPQVFTLDYDQTFVNFAGIIIPEEVGIYALGQVDTNRDPDDPGTPQLDNVALTTFNLKNISVADYNNDGFADVAGLSEAPINFVQIVTGNGSGNGTPNSVAGNGDNNGLVVAGNTEQALDIIDGDFDADGQWDDFAIAVHDNPPGDTIRYFRYTGGVGGNPIIRQEGTTGELDTANVSMQFTTVMIDLALPATILGSVGLPGNFEIPATALLGGTLNFQYDGYTFLAGDGGNSLTGRGGNGGSLGSVISLVDVADPVTGQLVQSLVGALKFIVDGTVDLFAGIGGNGFSSGGNGGSVSGVSVEQTQDLYIDPVLGVWPGTTITAGDGGRGVSGAGGSGGSIFDNSIDEGRLFQAGNGGVGRTGGNGGSIVGNGNRGNFDDTASGHGNIPVNGLYDAATVGDVFLIAGIGGPGTKRGGNGGSIVNFAAALLNGASASYTAGDGGNAVSGPGGNGGGVLDSSPLVGNFGSGDIVLKGGAGGNGTSGGNGGSVSNFIDKIAAGFDRANVVSVIGGNGGNGIAGVGGNGGSIGGIEIPSLGKDPLLIGYSFNRILAGNGGSSSSSRGGNGGNIANVFVTAQEASYAVVAGAGGDGLFNGGAGGGVSNLRIEVGGGPFANVLVAGGAGGNASAFIANPTDLLLQQAEKAFGGRVGVGGNGGSLTGIISEGNSQAHYNLIGGNGGDTITYGTALDPKAYVGRGGSISTVRISGDIGNITADSAGTPTNDAVPIKSYNDLLGGESFAEWVTSKMRLPVDPLPFFPITLDDTDGNVGIVVGAAGRNKAALFDPGDPTSFRSQPTTLAKNGDLVDVVAKNLLSAVAGSVQRIAAINVVKGIRIEPGIIGAEKGQIGAGDPNYFDAAGNPTLTGEPVLEGMLENYFGIVPTSSGDGAVVAHRFLNLLGQVTLPPGKVFVR